MLNARLNIRYPIILASMAGVSTPELAAEVSNAGALGSLGLGASSVQNARKQIIDLKSKTTAPFLVNFFCHETLVSDPSSEKQWVQYCCEHFQQNDLLNFFDNKFEILYHSFLENDDLLTLIIQEQVPIVSFHFGIPKLYQIEKLKAANIVTMASATNISEAIMIEKAGIDIIIAQGIEAGGHRGTFNPNHDASISTMDLVKLIRHYSSLPIIATGGIMNGFQAKKYIEIGASAVQVGTSFIQCSTSNASLEYKAALFSQNAVTQITSTISGRRARGIVNNWHLYIDTPNCPLVPNYPHAYFFAKKIYELTQNKSYYPFWAGSNVRQIRSVEAPELIKLFTTEMGYN